MLGRRRKGRSESLTLARIISTAKLNWRIPFSASRRALCSESVISSSCSAMLCRPAVTWASYLVSASSFLSASATISWPAPGSEDTELGVLMELEVGHGETEVHAGVQA